MTNEKQEKFPRTTRMMTEKELKAIGGYYNPRTQKYVFSTDYNAYMLCTFGGKIYKTTPEQDDENERWLEKQTNMILKYTTEFEDNVCSSHLPAIRESVRSTLFGDDDDLITSELVKALACTAEYGIRFLIDNMIFDPHSLNKNKLYTIGSIRTKLAVVRARVDDVLDRAEKEIACKDDRDD